MPASASLNEFCHRWKAGSIPCESSLGSCLLLLSMLTGTTLLSCLDRKLSASQVGPEPKPRECGSIDLDRSLYIYIHIHTTCCNIRCAMMCHILCFCVELFSVAGCWTCGSVIQRPRGSQLLHWPFVWSLKLSNTQRSLAADQGTLCS